MPLFSAPILYHSPSHLVGSNLSPKERQYFLGIIKEIRRLFVESEKTRKVLIQACKKFILTDKMGMDASIPTLKAVVKYIRHSLIDTQVAMIYLRIIRLIDALIRKCGIRAHVLIGRKRFLQTVSLTARRWELPVNLVNDPHAQEAADFAFDCVMAWHETFYHHRQRFPYYSETYFKLKNKYHVKFQRQEHDPSRLPIDFEATDPDTIEYEDLQFNESVDTDRSWSDAHVSYSVYKDFENSSFLGGHNPNNPNQHNKEFTVDDASLSTFNTFQESETYTYQYQPKPKAPKEGPKKTVSIDAVPKFAPVLEYTKEAVVVEETNKTKEEEGDYGDIEITAISSPERIQSFELSSDSKSFELVGSQDDEDDDQEEEKEQAEAEKQRQLEEERMREMQQRMIEEEEEAREQERAKHRSFRLEAEVDEIPHAPPRSPDRGSENPTTPKRISFREELQPEHYASNNSIPSQPNSPHYAVEGRPVSSVSQKIAHFNSSDSSGGRRYSKSSMSAEKDKEKNLEIRFFGNQRVVIRKNEGSTASE